jgi:hypothetical protein
MTYGALLAGAGSVVLGINSALHYPQYFLGAGHSGAAVEYYCRGDSFQMDNRLAQEVVAAMISGYVTAMYLL